MTCRVLTLGVAITLALAGCKPAKAPRVSKDQNGPTPQSQQPDKPRRLRPQQPPIRGNWDVTSADREELIQCLGHEEMAVRQAASERIVAHGSEAVSPLIAALDDENYHVRAGAVFSLGQLGAQAKPAVAKLEQLVEEDEFEAVRDAARFALHAIEQE